MEHKVIETQPIIAAGHFDLRPLQTSDAGLLALYAGDARVASMTPSIPHPLPPGAAEAMIERAADQSREEVIWALDGHKSGLGELLGIISLTRVSETKAEIAYWVGPAFWNAGYASEAVKALLAANPLGLTTVYGSVFQSNPNSARVLVATGFEYIGDAESFCVAQNRVVPTWTYVKTLG